MNILTELRVLYLTKFIELYVYVYLVYGIIFCLACFFACFVFSAVPTIYSHNDLSLLAAACSSGYGREGNWVWNG